MKTAAVQQAAEDFYVGDWLVQPSLGSISRPPGSSRVEPKAMEVLLCLARHSGAVVSKNELLKSIWPDTFVTEHVLTQAVWQLRHAFAGSEVIQTIPRRGYRLTARVRAAAAHVPALAVLPLANLSANPEQEYFADGMTEALISAVAQIGGLRVISRTSVMQYKATPKPLPEIAAELNVDTVVEGSVMRGGDRVRLSVQLINAVNDQHLWAKNYDRDLRDVLELQDEMARTIAGEIQVRLTPEEDGRLARSRPVNPIAHELYLKGRYCGSRTTQDSVRMSVDYMHEAIAADPDYALAHAGLANSISQLSNTMVSAMPVAESVKLMRPAIQRALELDPTLAEAHRLLAWVRLFGDWDWTGAEQAYRRALSLNPSLSLAYVGLAWVFAALNRMDEAVAAWRQACKLDPLSLFLQANLGYVTGLAGRFEEAAEHFQRTIRLEPNYFYPYALLAGAFSHLGRHEEAIAAAEAALRLCGDPTTRAHLGYVYAHAGRTADARLVLGELQDLERSRYVTPSAPAAILVALGEFDRALDYLEKAQQVHEPDFLFVRAFPAWRPLHGHPRFQELVRRMNFPE